MPARSGSVRWEPFGSGLVLHDEARAEIHVLNSSGALVWDACDGVTAVEAVVRSLAVRSGKPESEIDDDVVAHLGSLRAAGLVDRPAIPNPVQPVAATSVEESFATPCLRVLDQRVIIGTNEAELVDQLMARFGALRDDLDDGDDRDDRDDRGDDGKAGGVPANESAVAEVGFHRRPDGSTRVYGRGHDQILDDPDDADQALSSLINRLVASVASPLALHAGAVRSPAGRVVIIPGRSGAGKSTLTAALVASGWDYLTDEAAGIRVGSLEAVGYPKPLSLDQPSQRLLAMPPGRSTTIAVTAIRPDVQTVVGDGGPVHAVVAPTYRSGAVAEVHQLGHEDALVELAGHAINLAASGQAGLRTLVDVARRVPTYCLVHSDLDDAVRAVERVLHR